MTLSSATIKDTFNGDGSTKDFATTWIFWNSSEIQVILVSSSGNETTWTEGTEYTVTAGGSGTTGTVTASTGPTSYVPASGTQLILKSNLQNIQETSLPAGGTFPSTSVEQELDRTVRRVQQEAGENDRAIKLLDSSTYSNVTLPNPTATEFLRWNTAGTALENAALTGSGTISNPVTVAEGGTGSTQASAARTALGLEIGTDVQAYDADLAAVAGISWLDQDLMYYGSSGGLVALASESTNSGQYLTSGGSSAAPSWTAVNPTGLVYLASATASSDATVEFGSSLITSTYSTYLIQCRNVSPTTNSDTPSFRIATSGTLNTSSSDYVWQNLFAASATVTGERVSDSEIQMLGAGTNQGSSAGRELFGEIWVMDPASASVDTTVRTSVGLGGGSMTISNSVGKYKLTEANDGVGFFYTGGNVKKGEFNLYGISS